MKKFLLFVSLLAVLLALGLLWRIHSSLEDGESPSEPAPRALSSPARAPLSESLESHSRRDFPAEEEGREPFARVRIQTVEKVGGVPISGTEVFLVLAERSLSLGTTGSEGQLEAKVPSALVKLDFAARVPGYASLRKSFPRPTNEKETLVLRLSPGRSLEGQVVWRASGEPVGAGFGVLASEEGVYPTLREVRRTILGESGLPLAATRADGTFRLDGLPLGALRVWSGGPGGAVPFAGIQVPAQTQYVEVPVLPMVGAQIRLREKDGNALRTSPISHAGGIQLRYVDSQNRRPEGVDPFGAALAGVDLQWLQPGKVPPWEFLLLKAGWEDGGPVFVEVQTQIPGYLAHAETIELPPLAGSPARYDLLLEREASDWGTLEIVFSGLGEGPSPLGAFPSGVGKLTLDRAGKKTTYWQANGSFWSTFETLKGRTLQIPFGDYRWSFHSRQGLFRVPPSGTPEERPVVTISNLPQRIEIDCSLAGGLEILPITRDESFGGQLLVHLFKEKDPDHPFGFDFARPPYRIPLLPSGFYEIEALNPPSGKTKVFVAPGRFDTPVALQLKQGELVR